MSSAKKGQQMTQLHKQTNKLRGSDAKPRSSSSNSHLLRRSFHSCFLLLLVNSHEGLPAALEVGPSLKVEISNGLALVSGSVVFSASLVVASTSHDDALGVSASLSGKRRDPESGSETSDLAEAHSLAIVPLTPDDDYARGVRV